MSDLLAKFRTDPAPPAAPRPPISEIWGSTSRAWSETYSGHGVTDSRDLHRILELPRRPRPSDAELERLRDDYTARLGRGPVQCTCTTHYKRTCPKRLLPIQAWALHEAAQIGGILGPIGVGDGKTLLDLLVPLVVAECKVAVLLIPPNLREQLLGVDWHFYGQHYRLPNLAGGRWFDRTLPMLHVVSFSELSSKKNSDLLSRIRPDLVVVDEGHNLRHSEAARTKRFLRYFREAPATRLCVWSGTLTSRSLKDFAHLARLSLGDGSPVPNHWPVVEEWAGALDPGDFPTAIGKLALLCQPGEHVRSGFNRRLEQTSGVVSSPDTGNCKASLVFNERRVTPPPEIVQRTVDLNTTWERPDGELLVDAFSVARCARELACGFFYRWKWPRAAVEAGDLIARWLEARKAWHRELRDKLKNSREGLDSPALCRDAAIRYHTGYRGDLPVWAAQHWLDWKAVRDEMVGTIGQGKPDTEAVWIHDFLARDAADWLAGGPGIVWYEHDAFGRRVGELSQLARVYGPGEESARAILACTGAERVVASIRAHGTGKNLQAFARNLIANPPVDGAAWEQLIGRTHRQGQIADEVTVDVYRHMPAMVDALERARLLAAYQAETLGGQRKLLIGRFLWEK